MSEETGTAPEGEEEKLDETIPGGRYQDAQGHFVNAKGQRIEEDGTVIEDAPQPVKAKDDQ